MKPESKSLSVGKKCKNFTFRDLSQNKREEKRVIHTAKDGWIIEIRDK